MIEIIFRSETDWLKIDSEEDGDGDFLVAIEVEADGFKGHADGHVSGKAWSHFLAALIELERNRFGEAILVSACAGEFHVRVGALKARGHMCASGILEFSRQEWPRQKLEFGFEFDRSQLANVQPSIPADA